MRFKHEHPVFSTFSSNYTSLTFDSETGRLKFFGVESGGRDWDRHGTYSVLMPESSEQIAKLLASFIKQQH